MSMDDEGWDRHEPGSTTMAQPDAPVSGSDATAVAPVTLESGELVMRLPAGALLPDAEWLSIADAQVAVRAAELGGFVVRRLGTRLTPLGAVHRWAIARPEIYARTERGR